MQVWLRHQLARRPWWMNALLLFCAFMAFIYVPWDLMMKPTRFDEEVWFGIRFDGVWAKLLELPHWLVYGAGVLGFWRMRAWMWPWATYYTAQVSFSMAVWPLLYKREPGAILGGLVAALVFAVIARELWRARELFQPRRHSLREAPIPGLRAGGCLGHCSRSPMLYQGPKARLTATNWQGARTPTCGSTRRTLSP